MPSEREALYSKLYRFYEQYDPERLNDGIDAVVDFGLTEGQQTLNQGLIERYGVGLDNEGGGHQWTTGEVQIIRSRIEMFYLKHDPSKLDNESDIEAVIEWAKFHGLDALSDKLGRKYEEGIEDVQDSDVLVQLESFYMKHDPGKSQEDIKMVLTWGVVNGFTTLSKKMREKYGEGLGSTDRKKLAEEIRQKLTKFYSVQDKTKTEDPENISFVAEYALKYGLNSLNSRLMTKYGSHLNSVVKGPRPPSSKPPPSAIRRTSDMVNGALRKSLSHFTKSKDPSPEQPAMERNEYLRKLVEVFYARHDPNRLLEEGVSPIVEFAINSGEEALNVKLRKKYNEDLSHVGKQFQEVRTQLMTFYKKFDPSKLDKDKGKDLDTIVGWALVHGVEKLNATLLKKYNEDLNGGGLRARLQAFYLSNDGQPKNDKDLEDIITWTKDNSIEELNAKLQKKYGKTLNDMDEEIEPPPPPPMESPPVANYRDQPPPKPKQSSKGTQKAPLPPTPPPDLFPSTTTLALPEENQRQNTHAQLEDRLRRFYQKRDPTRADQKTIERDVKTILSSGIEGFNQNLMQTYGDNLGSTMRPASLKKKPSVKGGKHFFDTETSRV